MQLRPHQFTADLAAVCSDALWPESRHCECSTEQSAALVPKHKNIMGTFNQARGLYLQMHMQWIWGAPMHRADQLL